MQAVADHLIHSLHVGGKQFLELFEGHERGKKRDDNNNAGCQRGGQKSVTPTVIANPLIFRQYPP